jgi:hypothetical protein
MSRYARRCDTNHSAIVKALRACGCSVQSLAPLGRGCPDLLVGHNGRDLLIEVKREAGLRGGLAHRVRNEEQEAWAERWRGSRVRVARTPDEALAAVMSMRVEELRQECEEQCDD